MGQVERSAQGSTLVILAAYDSLIRHSPSHLLREPMPTGSTLPGGLQISEDTRGRVWKRRLGDHRCEPSLATLIWNDDRAVISR